MVEDFIGRRDFEPLDGFNGSMARTVEPRWHQRRRRHRGNGPHAGI